MEANAEAKRPSLKRKFTSEHFEIIIWFAFVVYVGKDLFEEMPLGNPSLLDFISYWSSTLMAVTLAIFVPTLFRVIFGELPGGMLIRYMANTESSEELGDTDNKSDESDPLDTWNAKKVAVVLPLEYLASLAVSSRKLAKGLRTRSSVYLFIGVIISFTGLLFFYNQVSAPNRDDGFSTIELLTGVREKKEGSAGKNDTVDVADINNKNLIHMAQSFGILFFIEFVAFFFLKQYRSAMDEFRYYESLQRYREETLAMMKFIKEDRALNPNKVDKDLEIYAFVEKCGFRTSAEKLESGQSTELLESKKLNKDETEIFNKILDILGKK